MEEPTKEQRQLLRELTSLVHEAKRFNDNAEELYILLDHVWRNREEIYGLLEPREEPAAIQEETREQIEFCCASPDLRWEGDEDCPSVACRNCGFTVVDAGNVVTYTPEEVEQHREETREKQRSLFE